MKRKIGRVPGKAGLYPDVYSAVINRSLSRQRKRGEACNPLKYLEYARQVERRYNRMCHLNIIE